MASPVDVWHMIDDTTGKGRGLVRIVEASGTIYARVEGEFDAETAGNVCLE